MLHKTPSCLLCYACLGLGATAPLFCAPAGEAAVINVPGDQPTIQVGISAAIAGDEVVVAPGTYVENIDFAGTAITVRGTDPGDPTVVMSTIIDGGGIDSVVTTQSGEGPGTVLSGFVITNGQSTFGGGMLNDGGSPTVSNCTFAGNSAGSYGGGMYNDGGSPLISNCTFTGNWAGICGGGMYNFEALGATLTNCTFGDNTSAISGGGMYNDSSSPTLIGCEFTGNTGRVGGGIYNLFDSAPRIVDSVICGNTPDQVAGDPINDGGGVIMGAYCPPPAALCDGDANGDGAVDVLDLLTLLAAWGACP